MHVAKLRIPTDETGLVPAGTYFQRLAAALREANERAGTTEIEQSHRVARSPSSGSRRAIEHAATAWGARRIALRVLSPPAAQSSSASPNAKEPALP